MSCGQARHQRSSARFAHPGRRIHHAVGCAPAATNNPALPSLPPPDAKPREIRTALQPEYREEFDLDYQEALESALVDYTGQAGAPPGSSACS